MHCPNCQHENPNEANFCMKCGTKLDYEAMSTSKTLQAIDLPAEIPFDASMTQKLTPLVGRELELAWLLEWWARAREGEGQVVLLSGEAGIGKSRLVQTLKDLVAQDEPAWLAECRCLPDYQNSALYPFINLLERELLSFEQGDSSQQKFSKLKEFLTQDGFSLFVSDANDELRPKRREEMTSLFAKLLSINNEGYAPMDLTPEQQKQKILQAMLSVLLNQAKRQPVLLIVEELHWVDASTIKEWLGFLKTLVTVRHWHMHAVRLERFCSP